MHGGNQNMMTMGGQENMSDSSNMPSSMMMSMQG
jgi:hypothetical protein